MWGTESLTASSSGRGADRPSLRGALAVLGVAACGVALAAKPVWVERIFVAPGAQLDAGDLRWLAFARLGLLALGLVVLAVAAAWPALVRGPLGAVVVATAPVAIAAGALAYKAHFGVHDRFYQWLHAEDSLTEWSTALVYLAACAAALTAARRFGDAGQRPLRLLWRGLAVALFVVGMEEISWGQRVLGIATPDVVAAVNAQDEITLHNLEPVQRHLWRAYVVVGLAGALAWSAAHLPRLGWLRWLAPRPLFAAWFLPVAAMNAIFLFAPTTLVDGYPFHLGFFDNADEELAELLLATGFLLFALDVARRLRAEGPVAA